MPISNQIHRCSRVSYRMDSIKKETKLNVRHLNLSILMKQYVKLHITVVILTVIKAHKVMATYISRKI